MLVSGYDMKKIAVYRLAWVMYLVCDESDYFVFGWVLVAL